MYFLDIKTLKEEINRGNLSFKSATNYFVWWLAFACYTGYEAQSAIDPIIAKLSSLAMFILHVGCLYWCSKKYGGANSDSFFKLFFPIAWVVGWRCGFIFFLLIFFLYLPVSCFPGLLNSLPSPASLNVNFMVVIGLFIGLAAITFYYWRIGVHLSELREQT